MAIGKNNDWIVASMSNPDATLDDFRQEGLTSDNTELKDRSVYLANENIKNSFKDEKGKFDEKAFNDFYDTATITYNKFANDDFDKTTLNDSYFFKEDVLTPKKHKTFTEESVIKKVSNPFRIMTGFVGTNKNISNNPLSIREIAQDSEVKDSKGKSLGWTPNDDSARGIFDFFTKDSVVLAQWDEEGTHTDPFTGEVKKHKKGEFKTNENGDFFYETLENRDPSNRIMLSVWDTTTKEGTWANEIDFMDSDGIDKSVVGSIAKAAALSLPAFIPGFGKWYTAAMMGKELLDVVPSTIKAIGALTGNDVSQWDQLDKVRALSRRMTSSTSDYSKSRMFTTENVANMMSDVFLQLSQQRLLAEIPFNFGMNKAEKEAIKLAKEKYGDNVISEFLKSTDSLDKQSRLEALNRIPGLSSVIDKYVQLGTKGGQYISTAYMAGTSAIGIVDEAKQLGLDDRDTGAMLLGLSLGYGVMMRKFEVGHWVEKGLGMDDLDKTIRGAIKQATNEYKNDILKVKSIPDSQNSFLRIGKNISKFLTDKLENANPYLVASLAEGVEEVTEEVMSDNLKVAYNAMNSLGLTSTKEDRKFSFTPEDIMSRYLMNFVGGAMGGAIFKLNENFTKGALKNNPESLNKDLVYLVRNGYTDRLLKEIEKQEKNGSLGSKNLSLELANDQEGLNEGTLNYKPTSNPSETQNAFVGNLLRQEISYIDDIIRQENIPSDRFIDDIYSERTDRMVNLGLNSSIRDDLKDLSNQIIQKRIELDKATEEKSPNVLTLTKEINELRKQISEISSGDKFDYYYQQALFSMNDAINSPYGVMSINDFAKQKYGKNINEFDVNSDERKDIEDSYNEYIKKDSRKQSIKTGFTSFEDDLNKVSKLSKRLNDFGNQSFGYYDNVQSIASEIASMESEIGEIDNVKDALKAKFIDFNSYDIPKIQEVINNNEYLNDDFKKVINNTFSKITKDIYGYQSLEQEDLESALASVDKLLLPTESSQEFIEEYDEDDDSDDFYYDESESFDYSGNFSNTMQKLNNFINSFDLNASNISEFKSMLKSYLVYDKDFNTSYSNSTQLRETFAQASFRNINKVVDSITNSLLSKNQELVNLSLQYDNFLKEVENKSKNNPLNDLLKQIAIEIEGQESTTPVELLQSQMSIFDNLSNPDDFVIDNKITSDQIDIAIKAISRVQSSVYSLTDYSYMPDGFSSGDIYGFGKSVNHILEKDGQQKRYDLLTTRANASIFAQLQNLKTRLEFLKRLSDYNDDNKIANFKYAGLNISAMLLKSIEEGGELFESLRTSGVDMSTVTAAFASSPSVNDALQCIDDNINITNSDDFIKSFEIEKTNIESALYNAVKERYNSLATNDEKVKFLQQISNSILNTFQDRDFESLIEKKTTEFNKSSKSVEPMDKLTYLISVMFSDSLDFYNQLKGIKQDDKFNGIESMDFAPFSAQEHAIRLIYAMSENGYVFNYFLNDLLIKITNYKESGKDEYLKTKCSDFFKIKNKLSSSIFVNGVPGSGKTTCVINTITNILANKGKQVAIFGPTNEQGEDVINGLTNNSNVLNMTSGKSKNDLFNTLLGNELYNKLLNYQNKIESDSGNEFISATEQDSSGSISFKLSKESKELNNFLNSDNVKRVEINGKVPSVIIIDEATHLSKFEYQLLNNVIENHNKNNSEKIRIILTGDMEQNGFTSVVEDQEIDLNLNEVFTFNTPTLSQSIRTSYNIKTRNINTIRALKSELAKHISDNNFYRFNEISEYFKNFKFKLHYDETNGLKGDKFVENITLDDIKNIVSVNNSEVKPGKIGVIVDNKETSNVVKMLSSIPDFENIFEIKTPYEVQGKEYNYVIIDVKNDVPQKNSHVDETFVYIKKIYTAISRSKIGSIVSNKIINSLNYENVSNEIIAAKTSLSQNKIEEFKNFRIDVVNSIAKNTEDSNLEENEIKDKSEKPETKEKQDGKVEPEKAEVSDGVKPSEQPDETGFDDSINLGVIGDSFRNSDKLQEIASDVDIRIHSSYERLGIVSDKKQIKVKSNTEDLPAIYNALYKKGLSDATGVDAKEILAARDELKKIVSAFVNKSMYKNLSTNESMHNILDKHYGLSNELLSKLDFNNFKLALRIKPYELFDRRYDAYYDSNKALKVGQKVGFLIAEVPIKNSDKFITITIGGLADINNSKLPKEVLTSLQQLHVAYNAASKENKDVRLYVKKENYDYILTPKSSLVIANLYKKDENEAVIYDEQKKPRSVQIDINEFRNKHKNLKISPVYIYTGHQSEKMGKVPVDSGRAFILVSANKQIGDLMKSYEIQLQKESKYLSENGNLDGFNREIKLIPLNSFGETFDKWYENNVNVFESKEASRLMKVYSAKYIGVRIHNSLSMFLKSVMYLSKYNKYKLSDISFVDEKDKISIDKIVDSLSNEAIMNLANKYKLSSFKNETIKAFTKEIFFALVNNVSYVSGNISINDTVILGKMNEKYINDLSDKNKKLGYSEKSVISDDLGYAFVNSFVKSLKNSIYNVSKFDQPETYANRMNILKSMYSNMLSVDFPNGIYYNAAIYDKSVKNTDRWALKADDVIGNFNVNFEIQNPFLHIRNDMLEGLSLQPETKDDEIALELNKLNEFYDTLDINEFYAKTKSAHEVARDLIMNNSSKFEDLRSMIIDEYQKEVLELEEMSKKPYIVGDEVVNFNPNDTYPEIDFNNLELVIVNNKSSKLSNNFSIKYLNENSEIFATFEFEDGVLINSEIFNKNSDSEQVDLQSLHQEVSEIFDKLAINPNISDNVERIRKFYDEVFNSGSMILYKHLLSKRYNDIVPDIKSVLMSENKEKVELIRLINEINNILEC